VSEMHEVLKHVVALNSDPKKLGIFLRFSTYPEYQKALAVLTKTINGSNTEYVEASRDSVIEALRRELEGAKEYYEKLKQAHSDYIFMIREKLGMKTPGDGFIEFLTGLKAERDDLQRQLDEATVSREEPTPDVDAVAGIENGAEFVAADFARDLSRRVRELEAALRKNSPTNVRCDKCGTTYIRCAVCGEDSHGDDHAGKPLHHPSCLLATTSAELAALKTNWQPIETAPKDKVIIVSGGIAHWRNGEWWTLTGEQWPGRPIEWEVKHWMPLPTVAALKAERSGE
jgi:hypothetical protein